MHQLQANCFMFMIFPCLSYFLNGPLPFLPTFIFCITRIEKVSFTSSTTQAKIIGTITSISGALLIVLYKGPKVIPSSTSSSVSLQWPLESTQSNWVIGGLLEALAYLFFSFWYIVQVNRWIQAPPPPLPRNLYLHIMLVIYL